jgi:predicted kinase
MPTPWLLITCGYPFSGKSTLARTIAELLDLELVSVDDQHHGPVSESLTDRDWLLAYKAAIDLAREALGTGRSVVFDSVGHTRRNRYRLSRLAKRTGAQSLVVLLDVTVDEARDRLKRNQESRVRAQVPLASFEQVVREFERPGPHEVQVIFHPASDPRRWVDTILRSAINR